MHDRDTAGQERLQAIGRSYYRRADCMIICYDISTDNPFGNFYHWRTQIEEHADDEVVVIMVGCKTDLATNDERTQINRASMVFIISNSNSFASEINLVWYELHDVFIIFNSGSQHHGSTGMEEI